ncbi:hypothetical protein, partial [Zoogloea sp.]|uniref:hypothetical protein n=1 Tax=Zoogloea sp. TaxID=49181 RepID=UPI001AC14DFD
MPRPQPILTVDAVLLTLEDGQLKVACNALGKDLGAPEGKDAQEACKGAIKVMGEVKAKMGANIKIALDFQPPKCSASMSAMADCSGKCDVQATGGKAEVYLDGKLHRVVDVYPETDSGRWATGYDFPAAAVNKIRARLGLPPRVAAGSSVAVAEADEATVSGSKRGRGRLATM